MTGAVDTPPDEAVDASRTPAFFMTAHPDEPAAGPGSDATPPGRFVGIAVDHYQSDQLPDQTWPVTDVKRVRSGV